MELRTKRIAGQTPALATLCLKLYNRTKPCMANERFNNDILYAER
jgi:hypothetical protein